LADADGSVVAQADNKATTARPGISLFNMLALQYRLSSRYYWTAKIQQIAKSQ
jgi:hypothetical protein